MPWYQFAIDEQEPTREVEWFPDDVTALKVATEVTSELGRNNGDDAPVVLAIRQSSKPRREPETPPPQSGVPTLSERRIIAECHVNEGRRIIQRQQRLVDSLLPSSKIREAAEMLLSSFKRSQAIFDADLADIIKVQHRH
jgi:hypothetical protein